MKFSIDKNKIPSIGVKCHVTYTDQKIIKRFIASDYERRLSSSLRAGKDVPVLLADTYHTADTTLSFSNEFGVCFYDNTGSQLCIYKGLGDFNYNTNDIYVHVFTYCKQASENLAYQLKNTLFEKVIDKYVDLCYTHFVDEGGKSCFLL